MIVDRSNSRSPKQREPFLLDSLIGNIVVGSIVIYGIIALVCLIIEGI
jgi:hypothetical protein